MVRHPHKLLVSWTATGSYATGHYQPGTAIAHTFEGRADVNGKGNLVRTEDGAQIVYDWSFYTGPISIDIPYGATAQLVHNTGTWNGTVKRAAANQRGTQIWL